MKYNELAPSRLRTYPFVFISNWTNVATREVAEILWTEERLKPFLNSIFELSSQLDFEEHQDWKLSVKRIEAYLQTNLPDYIDLKGEIGYRELAICFTKDNLKCFLGIGA